MIVYIIVITCVVGLVFNYMKMLIYNFMYSYIVNMTNYAL